MFLLHQRQGRTQDHSITLTESDGSTVINVAANDVVRVKIGRGSSEPELDLLSGDPTDNGSYVTATVGSNAVTLRLAQGDVDDLQAGAYDLEVDLVDDSDSSPADAIKHIEDGVLYLHPSRGGQLGLVDA